MKNQFLFGNNKNLVHFIAKVAVFLAMTVALQYISGFAGQQLFTGSVVNMMLLLAIPFTGLIGSIIVGCATPFMAILIGMSSNIILVPFVAVGNALFVATFAGLIKLTKLEYYIKSPKEIITFISIVMIAASLKFAFMFFVCYSWLLPLIPTIGYVYRTISVSFGINQLFTALIGGAAYLALSRLIKNIIK